MLLDKTIVIRADPARVFRWLHPAHIPRWDHSLTGAPGNATRPLVAGALFDCVWRGPGFQLGAALEAVSVEEGRVLSWRLAWGDYERHDVAFLLDRVADGTRVRLVANVEPPFVLPCLVTEETLARAISRDADAALFSLKDLVEHEGTTFSDPAAVPSTVPHVA